MYQRHAAAGATAAFLAVAALVSIGRAAEFAAGGYSFSDELGGFQLLSAKGSGTPDDPVVLEEVLLDIGPATLVIRNRSFAGKNAATAQLSLVKRVENRSNRVWAGFEMELQEMLGKPSIYADGLSFKQYAVDESDVGSDSFTENERDFEPYDRLEFLKGHVDPQARAEFRVLITDPTPTGTFYLVQEPRLLAAGLPAAGPNYAAIGDLPRRP